VALPAPQERLENYKGKTVLVFSPHPDDDTLEFHLYYPEHLLVDKLQPYKVPNLYFFYPTEKDAN
jgi:hypothetical protein